MPERGTFRHHSETRDIACPNQENRNSFADFTISEQTLFPFVAPQLTIRQCPFLSVAADRMRPAAESRPQDLGGKPWLI